MSLFTKKSLLTLLVMIMNTTYAVAADPMSSQYRLRWATFDSGAIVSSSANYAMNGSLGQTSATSTLNSTNYQVAGGLFSIPDTDEDTVLDFLDNCVEKPNPLQQNANAGIDIFGNACDADLNNNGFVNFIDLGIFKSRFGTADAEADFNSNGFVNFIDLGLFKSLFGKLAGPSGLPTP